MNSFRIVLPINGNDTYGVTSDGVIINRETGKVLKQRKNNSGYAIVDLYKDHKKKTHLVHRLVAETYIPNEDNRLTVNHSDGDKSNNSADNLEWATYSENNQHAYDTGLHKAKYGEDASFAKYTEPIVRSICSILESGADPMDVSRALNVPVSLVRSIKTKRSWTHISDEYDIPESRFYMPDDIRETIKNLNNDGKSINEICDYLKWPRTSVYYKRIRRAINR